MGGGPSGLAGAIELARLVKADNGSGGGIGEITIGVLEKAAALGEHCLSGAVVDPSAFRNLFPDLSDDDFPFRQPVKKEAVYVLTGTRLIRIPTPAPMHNEGNYVASLCEMVRWLGKKAEDLGVDIFAGYPAEKLLVEGDRVIGVRTAPTGLDRHGNETSGYVPGTDIVAKITRAGGGKPWDLGPGVPRVATHRCAESADICTRSQGNLGNQDSSRYRDSTHWAGRFPTMPSAEASCILWSRMWCRSVWWWASITVRPGSTCTPLFQNMKLPSPVPALPRRR